jgi:type II secretion system protein N
MNLELWKARLLALRPMLLRALLYPVVFGFFFVTFVYFTFPYDRLAELIVAQAEAPRTTRTGVQPSGIELAIGSLEPTLLPGLEARDVAVTFLPQPATPGAPLPTGEGAPRPVVMRLDKLRVRLSILPLLWGRANVSFSLQGMQGEAEGSASMLLRAPAPEAPTTPPRAGAAPAAAPEGPVVTDLEVTTRDLDLGQLGPVVQAVGLPLGGRMSGTLRMEVPDGRASQATGEIRFAVDRMTVGDGRAQYQIPGFGGVTIEQIRAGRLDLNIVARTGVLTFERTAAHSPEFDLALDGRVGLRPVLSESGLDLGVRFRLTDVYRNKSEQAGRILTVMEMAPDLRRARRPDGMIAFRCIGTFSRAPRCLPDGRGMGANGGAAPTGMPAGMAP